MIVLTSCNRHTASQSACDIQKAYQLNEAKISIKSGVWGTVSMMEGNCMPSIGGPSTTCKHCAVKRVVRIYQYTTAAAATASETPGVFYDAFSTQLVKELTTDDNGFFQAEIPAGQYSIVVVENGKLYANLSDGQGGLSPLFYTTGLQNMNLVMSYKAAM